VFWTTEPHSVLEVTRRCSRFYFSETAIWTLGY